MTISIPTSISLVSTNVVDTTQTFNPLINVASFAEGARYQYLNSIYSPNVTIGVKDYLLADEAGYSIGQVLYKNNALHIHDGTSDFPYPKQPNAYTVTQDTGFDFSTWTKRYSKLQSYPAGFVDGDNVKTLDSTYGVTISGDGSKAYSLYNNTSGVTQLVQYSLTVGSYDIKTASPDGISLDTTISVGDIVFNSTGTKLLCTSRAVGYSYDIREYSLTTAWNLSSASFVRTFRADTQANHYYEERIESITMSSDGRYMYLYYSSMVEKWYLGTTAFSLISPSLIGYSYINPRRIGSKLGNGIKKVRFGNNGTKMYMLCSSVYGIYEFDVSAAYDPQSVLTLVGYKELLYYPSSIDILPEGMSFLFTTTNTTYIYKMVTAWSIKLAIHSKLEYSVHEFTGDIVRRHYSKFNGVNYSIKSNIYNLTTDTALLSTTGVGTAYTILNNDSIENEAIITGVTVDNILYQIFMPMTLIFAADGVYVRTHLTVEGETELLADHVYRQVVSPLDINGFSKIEATNNTKPFDGKNYSVATSPTLMTYTVTSDSKFDTIALGRLKADTVVIEFKDSIGAIVDTIPRVLDRSLDSTGNINAGFTTEIFYSTVTMDAGSTVEITLNIDEGDVELGTILPGISVDAGYSNLAMQHKYRDFSIAEYDTWGNIDYVEKQRINTYSGTVDVPITNYDRTIRLMTTLGKQLVIVNGSKSKIIAPDSLTVFASTQLIGRFFDFSGRTKVKDDSLEDTAEYSFVLEELA